MTVTEPTLTTEVDETTDLTKTGVLNEAELEKDVFVYGDTTDASVLRPGERCAVLQGGRTVLLYGYIPAVKAAATAIEYAGGDPDPSLETVAQATVEPATWALFTRHRLECETGGDPVACGCPQPTDDPDGYYVFGATDKTPGAVLVTPVLLPVELAETPRVTHDGKADAEWLIWSHEHRLWWAPDSCGYRVDVVDAGRYTREAAEYNCSLRSWSAPDRPPEVMVPAPSSEVMVSPGLREVMRQRVDAATSEAIALRAARPEGERPA